MVPQQLEMEELLPQDEVEAKLIQALSQEPTHIDELCRRACLPISTVGSTLAIMELKRMVQQLGCMNYVLASGVKWAKV